MKSFPQIFLVFVGLLLLFVIGVYNILELFNANWIQDAIYQWLPASHQWGKTVRILSYLLLIFIPLFSFAFWFRDLFSRKPIVCKHGANKVLLTEKSIIRSLKQVILHIPSVLSIKIKVWNKRNGVAVELSSVVKAGTSLPELNEEIKFRAKETLTQILGFKDISLIRSIIEDIKFTDKELVAKAFEKIRPNKNKDENQNLSQPAISDFKTTTVSEEIPVDIFDSKQKSISDKLSSEEIKEEEK